MPEGPMSKKKIQILTIPNILSIGRIFLIPLFVWAYCFRKQYSWAFWLLILSGVTDIVDGFIARRFHMVSDLGKALDPIADKLTQAAVLLCLGSRFPVMFFLAGLLIVKESISGLMSLLAIRKTNEVKSADWHGKVTTCLLYLTMFLHILWTGIPEAVSILLTALCVLMMAISFIMYFRRNTSLLRKSGTAGSADIPPEDDSHAN